VRKSENAGQARFRARLFAACGIVLGVFFIKEWMGIAQTSIPWALKVCTGVIFLGFPGIAFAAAFAYVHEAKLLEREENKQDVP